MRKPFFTWPPHPLEPNKSAGIRNRFFICLIIGLYLTISGIGKYFYTDLCWTFGRSKVLRVTNKYESGRNNSEHILVLDNSENQEESELVTTSVSLPVYNSARINDNIPIKYFKIFPKNVIADPGDKWYYLVFGLIGIILLVIAKRARQEYMSLTNKEVIPTWSQWSNRMSAILPSPLGIKRAKGH